MKRYFLENRLTRRRQSVYADSFQSACKAVGWYPADTCLLKVEPFLLCDEEDDYAPTATEREITEERRN
jgi:hypothetical protein